MKTILKKVHYCEYCKKHGLRSDVIKTHELHCTLNPDRECRVCGRNKFQFAEFDDKLLSDPFDGFGEYDATARIEFDRIKKEIDCAACYLSFLRQHKLQDFTFNYKAECEAQLREKHEEESIW